MEFENEFKGWNILKENFYRRNFDISWVNNKWFLKKKI